MNLEERQKLVQDALDAERKQYESWARILSLKEQLEIEEEKYNDLKRHKRNMVYWLNEHDRKSGNP